MALVANHNDKKFEIVEDLPEVGFYLLVYDNQNNCLFDFLQDTEKMAKEFALENFQVEISSWNDTTENTMQLDDESIKNQKLIAAWKLAAIELQIKITSPFTLKQNDGNEYEFLLCVHNFGNELGTLISSTSDKIDTKNVDKSKYYFSKINPSSYSVYDKDLFIDTLNDWGYFGENNNKPIWYKGNGWTE